MTDRILDISDEPAALSVRMEQLIVAMNGKEHSVPLEDIAVMVVSEPRVSYTHAVLAGLAAKGAPLVVCDGKRLPCGMLLPLESHFTQAERFSMQAQVKLPVKKRLWREIVRAKVRAQGRLLQKLRGGDEGLAALAGRVASGDPENVEAQASRRYWPALLGDSFRRDRRAEDINRHLNYGYAVLRAMVARAVCAAGLHPSFGLHHHNRYDAFCLADDLMEPFRPLVDAAAFSIFSSRGADAPLDKEAKAALIGALTERRYPLEDDMRTLFDVLSRVAQSLVGVYSGEEKKLALPEISP